MISGGTSLPYKQITVTGIRQEAEQVKTFTFAAEEGYTYKAGQFITLLSAQADERRSYSFSSSPATDKEPCFTVKRVDNGVFSRYLTDRVKIGDTLRVIDPAGFFTLPEDINVYEQVFFFAAGIGITPVFSLIKTILAQHPHIEVILIYSNRTVADTVFYTELETLAARYPRFTLRYLFSTSPDLMNARLNKQLIPRLLKEHSTSAKKRQLFYVCGPFPYMRMVIYGLEEQNISSDSIKKENFDTRKPVHKNIPPDISEHDLTIVVSGHSYIIKQQYPDTILRAAKKNGIELPYSCETGKCGTCAVHCTAGKIWMSENEVLTDNELKKGFILTCTGFVIEDGTTIEII